MKLILLILIISLTPNLQAKDRTTLLLSRTSNIKSSTFIVFSSINNLTIGLAGETTLYNGEVSGCGYYMGGYQFLDCVSVLSMAGYGSSTYNTNMVQIGALVALRVKFINVGIMYNTTTKMSLVFGIGFRLNK